MLDAVLNARLSRSLWKAVCAERLITLISKLLFLQRTTSSSVLLPFSDQFKTLSLHIYSPFWYFRELPLTSSDPSSSSSTISRTLQLPCRCTILHLAPLDKVGGERWQLASLHTDDVFCVQQVPKMIKIVLTLSPTR